jgi:hypothetical protein
MKQRTPESPEVRSVRVQAELDAETKRFASNPKAFTDALEGQRLRLELYQAKSPSPMFLDMLELRSVMGEVCTIRQISPGVYTWIERGVLKTSKPNQGVI